MIPSKLRKKAAGRGRLSKIQHAIIEHMIDQTCQDYSLEMSRSGSLFSKTTGNPSPPPFGAGAEHPSYQVLACFAVFHIPWESSRLSKEWYLGDPSSGMS